MDAPTQRPGSEPLAPWLDAAAVAGAAGLRPAQVEVVDTVESTNQVLLQRPLERRGPGSPLLLIAMRQLAGRGRRGRPWIGDPEHCLAMSIALERRPGPGSPPLTGLSLALGVALADEASRLVAGIGLKWPNDLLRDGRKVAGMLVESRHAGEQERIVIGLGVNLRLPSHIAGLIDQPAGGLFDEAAPVPPREAIAGRLARALIDAAERFFESGFGDTALRWRKYDALAGREVTVIENGVALLGGVADGIERTGALRVRTADGVVPVSAGDVSVRPGSLPLAAGGRE